MKGKINYCEKNSKDNTIKTENHIALYIFGIKIKKISLESKIHGQKKSNKNINTVYMIIKQILRALKNKEMITIVNKIVKNIRVDKLDMQLGINVNDPIANAYIIAFINSIIPLYLAKNNKNINLDNINYYTFVSDKVIYLNVKSTIHFSISRNIVNIFNILFIIIKENIKEKIKNKKKRKEENKNLKLKKEYNNT